MADCRVIVNARLPERSGLYQIAIEAGYISAIAAQAGVVAPQVNAIAPQINSLSDSLTAADITDVEGDWVSLGAVDLQINGALGIAFPDLRIEQLDQLQTICELLWQQGVSGFCPTLVTTSLENFHGSLSAIQAFQRQSELKRPESKRPESKQPESKQPEKKQPEIKRAAILGAHLEGPFLNYAKRGAHPAQHLQPLTLEAVKALVGEFSEAISIITLAPEQAVEPDIIPWLQAQNIAVSLGHSLANEKQARDAFAQGATMVTHAFNAMPTLHHRQPGLLGAALVDPRVHCGFIADGQHICPTMLDLLLRIGRYQKHPQNAQRTISGLFLVSDALSPLGLSDGLYPWDSRQISVANGTARLLDGTLSGTTLPLIAGAQNLVQWNLCSAQEAIALVTTNPRKAIDLSDEIKIHQPAQLLRWSETNNQLCWQHL